MQELSGWAPKEFTEAEDTDGPAPQGQQQQQQQQQQQDQPGAATGASVGDSTTAAQPAGTSGYIYDEASGYYYDPGTCILQVGG